MSRGTAVFESAALSTNYAVSAMFAAILVPLNGGRPSASHIHLPTSLDAATSMFHRM